MPNIIKSHFTRLTGYTNPIVIRSMDAVGLPPEIEELPEAQKGPMSVTLMGQLASVTADAIAASLFDGPLNEKLERFRETQGGSAYRDLKREKALFNEASATLYQELQDLEELVTKHDLASIDTRFMVYGVKDSSFGSGWIYWNMNAFDSELVDQMRRKYQGLVANYHDAQNLSNETSVLIFKMKSEIDTGVEFQVHEKLLRERLIQADNGEGNLSCFDRRLDMSFKIQTSLVKGGIFHLLRNGDSTEWWDAIRSMIEAKINSAGFAGLPRAMLRDSVLNEKIKEQQLDRVEGGITGATAQILFSPGEHSKLGWKKHGMSFDGVRDCRRILRKEDEFAMAWIHSKTGRGHPSDIYRSMLSRNWTGPANPYQPEESYPPERAQNELSWCLSRQNNVDTPFVGHFTESYPEQIWMQRVARWGASAPDYWSWPQ